MSVLAEPLTAVGIYTSVLVCLSVEDSMKNLCTTMDSAVSCCCYCCCCCYCLPGVVAGVVTVVTAVVAIVSGFVTVVTDVVAVGILVLLEFDS